jgi:hypothetical protein
MDSFFFEIVGQHWFPTKSGIDQFLYIYFYAVNFIFDTDRPRGLVVRVSDY